MATFVPAAGNSRGAVSASACSMSTSASRGSTSTITASAASIAAERVSATTATTGSPTKRTVPDARIGRAISWLTIPIGSSGGRSRSAAVTTASTPGAVAASVVSISTMRPWAIVERTKTTCAAPGAATSST